MVDYNELYEILRKEKYGEQLQPISKNFISDVAEFLNNRRKEINQGDYFSEDILKNKKQLENAISIFRELMRIRKRKILNLVFVASETGIMRKDFSTMLDFEQELFEKLVKGVEEGDKVLKELLNGTNKKDESSKMIIMSQDISEFVDMNGQVVGPFEKGMLINIDKRVAEILVAEGKASYAD